MANTKHTRGPWAVDNSGFGKMQIWTNYKREGGKINPDTLHLIAIVNTIDDGKNDTLLANAKLIAAAPELLEALQKGLSDMIQWRDYLNLQIESFDDNEKQMMINNYNDAVDRVLKAEAAIKKATE